jgi:lipopolysaccharide transport system ATP-binding protein
VGSLLEVGTGFHHELSGRENIYLNGAILGMKRREIDSRLERIIEFAEVARFADMPVKHYSSGMYLRLAFAVAAHLDPEILIVDEVLAVGDASFQKKCLGKMKDVAHGDRTVLFVSHNMAAIENLCDRVLLVDHGRLITSGPPRQVIERYLSNISCNASIPLRERKDRKGAGDVKATKIEFLNGSGAGAALPVSGQELLIRLHYAAEANRRLTSCRASISVVRNDTACFTLATDLVSTQPLELFGEGFVEFVVPRLPLSEGTYQVESYLESNREIQDWIRGAAEFSVADGDFFGTGRTQPACFGPLVQHSWNHVSHRPRATELVCA